MCLYCIIFYKIKQIKIQTSDNLLSMRLIQHVSDRILVILFAQAYIHMNKNSRYIIHLCQTVQA